jgi:hypothetical protein
MNQIQQVIHDFLRDRLVAQEAVDWVNIEELSKDLVSKLGLAKSLGGQWVCFDVPYICEDGEQ